MPRSRTRTREHHARLAAGLIQPDPERTPARVRAWWRAVWKKAAAHEDYPRPWLAPRSRAERARAIRATLAKMLADAFAEIAELEAAAERGREPPSKKPPVSRPRALLVQPVRPRTVTSG